jgi:fucose 4-O-acetylase-like acetyltransferase
MNTQTERIGYLDALRGFAIFLMVMGHVLAWTFSNYNEAFDSNIYCGLVWKFIYAFHMPLLMFVSGYVFRFYYKENLLKESLKFISKKIIALLLPYITVGYLLWMVGLYGKDGYWFLLTLFELFVLCLPLYILSNKINKHDHLIIDLLIFAFGYFFIFFGTRFLSTEVETILDSSRISSNYLYFGFGCLLRRHEFIQKIFQKNLVYSLSLVMFFTLLFLRIFKDISVIGGGYIICFSAICFLYYLFRNCLNNQSKGFIIFSYLGVHSIEIYLIHFFFTFRLIELGTYLVSIKFYGTNLLIQLLYSIVISVIVIGLSLGVARIISNSKILSFILLGKKYKLTELFSLK